MSKDQYKITIKEIRNDIIMEIKRLFEEKEDLSNNIKMIKELTIVLKDLDRIFEKNDDSIAEEQAKKDHDNFYNKIKEKVMIPYAEDKK